MSHDCFYRHEGAERYVPTGATAGPWSGELQHAGPPSALLARAALRHAEGSGLRLSSIACDVLGPLPLEPMQLSVTTVRPGRRVRLVHVSASIAGREALVLRAWLTAPAPSQLAATSSGPVEPPPPLPDPDDAAGLDALIPAAHTAGYLSAVEARFTAGGFGVPGPAQAWMRPLVPLVDAEPMTAWDRTLVVADSGSGISLAASPAVVPAINCDLRVALHREPHGEWVHLSSTTRIEPGAGGLATTRLRDGAGELGTATQTLAVSAPA